MRVIVFLTCLCYLLLGGYNYMHASIRKLHHAIPACIDNTHQQKFTARNKSCAIVKELKIAKTTDYLLSENVEEDDSSHAMARKYRLLASFYLLLAGLLTVNPTQQHSKMPRPYHRLTSPIYITQGVLRL